MLVKTANPQNDGQQTTAAKLAAEYKTEQSGNFCHSAKTETKLAKDNKS